MNRILASGDLADGGQRRREAVPHHGMRDGAAEVTSPGDISRSPILSKVE
jgi:hypothetical protein